MAAEPSTGVFASGEIAHRAIVESEARLRAVFESMSEGLVVHAADGCVLEVNSAAERILGVGRATLQGRLPQHPGWRTIREDGSPYPAAEYPAIRTSRTGEPLRDAIMGIERGSQRVRWIRINTQPIYEGEPAVLTAVVATFTDVTAEREAAEDLRRARDELQSTLLWLRAITDRIPMSIALYDRDDRIAFANVEYAKLGRPGVRPEGALASEFLGPALYEATAAVRRRALAGERVRLPLPTEVSGELRQREVTYTPYRDGGGQIVGVLALGYDITESEASRARLREVAGRLATVREAERREVAMSLHERAAQDLYAARLAVERLRASAHDLDTEAALDDIHGILDQAVREIGTVTRELYPTALQHLPLADVLAQHAATFGQRSGVEVSFSAPDVFPVLAPEVRLLFFRALQEALTNVWRHARAQHVVATLAIEGTVRLVVEDDGVGLAPGANAKAGSLGLLGMRERFGALGGGLALGSGSLGGVRLEAWVPLPVG